MTVKEKFKKKLFDMGLFESQTEAIMLLAIPIIDKQVGTSREQVPPIRSKYNRRKRKRLKLGEFAPPVFKEVPTGYKITWDGPSEDFPDAIYSMYYHYYIKKVAYDWFEKNLPQAWCKPLFAPTEKLSPEPVN